MNLPAAPVNQGSGAVNVPLGAAADLSVTIYAATKTSAGHASLVPTPLSQYNAASYGALTATGSNSPTAYYLSDNAYSQADDNSPPTVTSYNFINSGTPDLVYYGGMQYKLHVDFNFPWVGSNAIQFNWREKTLLQSGTFTQVLPAGATEPDAPVYVESATETYVPLTETVTPAPGAMFAETTVHTIEATGLTLGTTVSIVGPNDTGYLSPGFHVYTSAQSAAKLGFLSYTVPESAPGTPVNPQPIYTNEAASTAPGAPASAPQYSGSQDTSGASVTPFSGNVPYQYISDTNAVEAYAPGAEVTDNADHAIGNIRQAVSVTPTVVQWPGSLVMTLSNPQDTSTITAPADAALKAIDFTKLFPSGQVNPGTQAEEAILALRNLPAHEQNYAVQKGIYSVWIYFTIDGGVTSVFGGQPAPITNSGSLAFAWTREEIDLDTGARTSTQETWTLPFAGVAGSSNPVAPAFAIDSFFVSPYYEEDVPATNLRVEISNLTITTPTLDCLVITPQAQIVSA